MTDTLRKIRLKFDRHLIRIVDSRFTKPTSIVISKRQIKIMIANGKLFKTYMIQLRISGQTENIVMASVTNFKNL